MTIRVRPFAAQDYAAFTRIRRIGEGERIKVEEARAQDERWDRSRYEKVRVVAVDEEDAPVGYGEVYHEPSRFEPLRYFVRMAVDPNKRRRGIGAAIWDHLAAELDERGARIACLWARDQTACAYFVVKRGFREVVRSYLQVRAAATAPVPTPATRERLAGEGIRIASLAELSRVDPDALVKAHDVYFGSRLDQPSLGRVTPVPFADWRAYHVDDPEALPDAYFIAVAGDRYVGQCTARVATGSADVLDIGVTAVLPVLRRRGIGRALKLWLHAYARANGFRELHTSNVRENAGIVRLNESLGYVIVDSTAGYELALIPSSP